MPSYDVMRKALYFLGIISKNPTSSLNMRKTSDESRLGVIPHSALGDSRSSQTDETEKRSRPQDARELWQQHAMCLD